jgi:hypothetical protein
MTGCDFEELLASLKAGHAAEAQCYTGANREKQTLRKVPNSTLIASCSFHDVVSEELNGVLPLLAV